MAAINPPAYIQASSHPSDVFRRALQDLLAGGNGVVGATDLSVAQSGTPAMNVVVAAGRAYITGSENALYQGIYGVLNDGAVTLTISAADATNPRIDIVVAQVQDAQYSGATNAWSLAIMTGTPAPTPLVPGAPNNSIILAQVNVPALAGSIVNANITDTRLKLSTTAALGGQSVAFGPSTGTTTSGRFVGAQAGAPTTGTFGLRDIALDTNTNIFRTVTAAGTPGTWKAMGGPALIARTNGAGAVNINFSSIPQTYQHLEIRYSLRSDLAAQYTAINCQFNGDWVATSYWTTYIFGGSGTAPVLASGAGPLAGYGAGGSAGSGVMGNGSIWIPDYNVSGLQRAGSSVGGSIGTFAAANTVFSVTTFRWSSLNAVTSIDLNTGGGNWTTASEASLYGWV